MFDEQGGIQRFYRFRIRKGDSGLAGWVVDHMWLQGRIRFNKFGKMITITVEVAGMESTHVDCFVRSWRRQGNKVRAYWKSTP
jgi:hypothetical protein